MNKRIFKIEEVTSQNIQLIRSVPYMVTNEARENVGIGDVLIASYINDLEKNELELVGHISKAVAKSCLSDNEGIIQSALDKKRVKESKDENINLQKIIMKFNEYEKDQLMNLVSDDTNETKYDAIGL